MCNSRLTRLTNRTIIFLNANDNHFQQEGGLPQHIMTLYEAQKDKSYFIEGLYVEPSITRRLQALGLNDGTKVKVLNRKKKGALIIQVRGTRLALGRHICTNIEVLEDASEEVLDHE